MREKKIKIKIELFEARELSMEKITCIIINVSPREFKQRDNWIL